MSDNTISKNTVPINSPATIAINAEPWASVGAGLNRVTLYTERFKYKSTLN